MVSFDPEDLLRTIERYKITFTSPGSDPLRHDVGASGQDQKRYRCIFHSPAADFLRSDPKDLKLAIMAYFKKCRMWEASAAPKAGW
jgi:hypothetical protein